VSEYTGTHRPKGTHRAPPCAYRQICKLTVLVTAAALTVAAGSAGAISTLPSPSIVSPIRATSTSQPASFVRDAGSFGSRSGNRVGLLPNGLDDTEAGRQQTVLAARALKAKAATARASKVSKAATDARKARAVAGQIEAVEALMDAERARRIRDTLRPSSAATAAAKKWAAREVARMGYGPEQFTCLDQLWTRESGWNLLADNPTSDAYGIPQSLPGSKMASAGADWRTNPRTQMTWGLRYIKARYGDPCTAWAHSERLNWY